DGIRDMLVTGVQTCALPILQERQNGRNHEWTHLYNADVISMPDKWEYPWYAAWDLAFHCIPLALVDSDFAKEQLTSMLREWYMQIGRASCTERGEDSWVGGA